MSHLSLMILTVVLGVSFLGALLAAHSTKMKDLPSHWKDLTLQSKRYHNLLNAVQDSVFDKGPLSLHKRHVLHPQTATAAAAAKAGNELGCDECEVVAAYVYEKLQNETWMNGTAGHDFRVVCDDLFKSSPKDATECKRVVDDIIAIVNHLAVQIDHWQVNFPEIVCADVLHKCIRPCCTMPYKPEQIRLSFASHHVVAPLLNMTVSWITLMSSSDDHVWWRVAGSNASWQVANATNRTYTLGGWIGVIHAATMINLAPGITFEYYVGSTSLGTSKTYQFSTLPLHAGTDARPIRVLAVADMGWGPNSDDSVANMIQIVEAGQADFMLHPGDIGYADGDQHWEDDYGRKIEPITARIPYMTVQGNHEQIWWNATSYKKRWWMLEPGDGAPDDATYYSFTAGPLKVLMLDTETVINTADLDPIQLRWAKTVMEKADDSKFLFVLHHRPFYCSSYSIEDCTFWAQFLKDQAEQLYLDQGVDLVMMGHIHNYERTYPVFNNKVSSKNYTYPKAPVYVVNGSPGNREGQADFYTNNNTWSAVRTSERGYMVLEFAGNAQNVTMHAQFIRSTDNKLRDEFKIIKKIR